MDTSTSRWSSSRERTSRRSCGRTSPLSLQEKLDIAIDILSGLSYAHKRGIVHRDIKPANIRIAEDGRAKLMDFGVAHLTSSKLTSTGASLGTPVYMSPEQITGGKSTPATDVFAVGAVLYELLTGCKPFDSQTLQGLFYKILTEKPTPIRDAMPGLPSALDHIVEKAMAKDALQRYQSALDMANDLTGVRSMLSGPSYPSSVSLSATVEHAIRRSKQAARVRTVRRELFAGGALVAVALVVLAWSQLGKSDSRAPAGVSTAPSTVARLDSTPTAPSAPVAVAPSPAPTTRVDSAVRPSAPEPAPKRVERPAPEPERPVRNERVARSTSPATSRGTGASATRPPATPPAAPGASEPATKTVAVAPPVTNSQPQVTPPTVQQGIVAPRPVPPPLATQSPPETPPASPSPPTAADVAPVFESYARAIESRDVSAIRRVYPGLTADQQRGFEQFFESARKIDVTFRVASVDGTASGADVRVTGSYQYESSSGRAERQGVSFAATLRRDGAGWRMVSLR
jgi:serine/threonine-protein kinase